MQEFETRGDMIRALVRPFGEYVEVGVFEGTFADTIATTLTPAKLVLIDIFEGTMGSGDQDGNNFKFINLLDTYHRLKKVQSAYPDSLKVLKGWSYEWLPTLEDDAYDMIYLDADHSYEGTLRDLRLAFPKVHHGGWLMGHDYEMNMKKAHKVYDFGVRQAVEEFCAEAGQEVYAKAMDGCVSFAIRVNKLGLEKEDPRFIDTL
jgi:predicted O-methyltransferase YrrM